MAKERVDLFPSLKEISVQRASSFTKEKIPHPNSTSSLFLAEILYRFSENPLAAQENCFLFFLPHLFPVSPFPAIGKISLCPSHFAFLLKDKTADPIFYDPLLSHEKISALQDGSPPIKKLLQERQLFVSNIQEYKKRINLHHSIAKGIRKGYKIIFSLLTSSSLFFKKRRKEYFVQGKNPHSFGTITRKFRRAIFMDYPAVGKSERRMGCLL